MNWNASATDWMKSSWRMVVMAILLHRRARRRDPRSDFPAKNFTIACAGKILRDVDNLRRLVGGEVLAAVGQELVRRDWNAGLRDHVGHDETLVGTRVFRDARAIGDGRMALHHAFDLIGRDA